MTVAVVPEEDDCLFEAPKNLGEERPQRRNFIRCHLLQDRLVDTEIFVDQLIPHATHLLPRNCRVSVGYFRWDLGRGLTDDLKASDDRIDGFLITAKGIEVHVRHERFDIVHRFDDVLDVVEIQPFRHT